MSAPIVYDSVPTSKIGSLFSGKKFWLAQRVPTRSSFIARIKANGGEISSLEKNADYLIADHARQDCPPDTISWTFIDKCLSEGRIVDPAEHLCNSKTGLNRPIGSSALTIKKTRRLYGQQEDDVIKQYMIRHLHQGGSDGGYEVFKEIVKTRLQDRTYQSVKDRWKKHISPFLTKNERDIIKGDAALPILSPDPKTKRSAPDPHSTYVVPPVPRRPDSLTVVSRPIGTKPTKTLFTPDDDRLILQHVKECREAARDIAGNKIWKELEDAKPHHTAQSWRSRYLKYLQHREAESDLPRLSPSKQRRNSSPLLAVREETPESEERQSPASSIETGSSQVSFTMPNKQGVIPVGQDGPVMADAELQVSTSPSPPKPQKGILLNPLPDLITKETFYQDLNEYQDWEGAKPMLGPTVGGKSIDLWEFFVAATDGGNDDHPIEHRDWEQIAEKLGLNWIDDEELLEKLQNAYRESLWGFEDMSEEREVQETGPGRGSCEPQLRADIIEAAASPRKEVELSSGEELSPSLPIPATQYPSSFPSSPPLLSTLKRKDKSPHRRTLDSVYPNSVTKRPRYDRNQVIPSTPEHVATTPRNQVEASPSRLPPPVIEPETQDFQFGTQAMDLGIDPADDEGESSNGTAPSRRFFPTQSSAGSKLSQPTTSTNNTIRREKDNSPKPTRRTLPKSFSRPSQESKLSTIGSLSASTGERIDDFELTAHIVSPAAAASQSATRSPQQLPTTIAISKSNSTKHDTPRSNSPPAAAVAPVVAKNVKDKSAAKTKQTPSSDIIPLPDPDRSLLTEGGELERHYTSFVAQGYASDVVNTALLAACFWPGRASRIIDSLQKGEDIPEDVAGVWSAKDDEELKFALLWKRRRAKAKREGTEGDWTRQDELNEKEADRYWRRLQKKHGKEGVKERKNFVDD